MTLNDLENKIHSVHKITKEEKLELAAKSDRRKFWIFVFIISFFAILMHEAAHMFAAIALGLDVKAYGIGLGPQIFAWDAWGIEWRIGPLFFGGFVELTKEASHMLAYSRPILHMFLFSSSGVLINALLALAGLKIYKKSQKITPEKPALINTAISDPKLKTTNIFLAAFIFINGLLFIFNLLPSIFLDGWKIWGSLFLAIFPQSQEIWQYIGHFGLLFIFLPIYGKTEKRITSPAKKMGLLKNRDPKKQKASLPNLV